MTQRRSNIVRTIIDCWQADGAPRFADFTFGVVFDGPPASNWRWRFKASGRPVEVYLSAGATA